MFDKIHMSFIPHFIRYGVIGLMAASPILAICFVICMDDDDEIQSP
tara:strand:+ start:616 stop:753 length:138 start_codon:yes stop_codon:yes gene_type:complete